jgi:hypothetical protein
MQKKNNVMNKVGFGGIINEQGRRKTKTIEEKKKRAGCCVVCFAALLKTTPWPDEQAVRIGLPYTRRVVGRASR